jgi:hypothetical protein
MSSWFLFCNFKQFGLIFNFIDFSENKVRISRQIFLWNCIFRNVLIYCVLLLNRPLLSCLGFHLIRWGKIMATSYVCKDCLVSEHGLRTPREEVAFTVRPKIHSLHSQIFWYGRRIFCLPHRPNFSDIFDLCLHWVSVVRVSEYDYCY